MRDRDKRIVEFLGVVCEGRGNPRDIIIDNVSQFFQVAAEATSLTMMITTRYAFLSLVRNVIKRKRKEYL